MHHLSSTVVGRRSLCDAESVQKQMCWRPYGRECCVSSLNYSIVQDWSRASYEFTQAPAALYVITGRTNCKGFKTRHLLGLQLTGLSS